MFNNSCKTSPRLMENNRNQQWVETISDLESLSSRLSKQKIVLGTGCFDLLHVGHLYYLKESRMQGDVLIIGLNSDSSVRRIKGPDRPIIREDHRAELLAAIRYVDYVFIFDNVVADECILNLKPDVYSIGEESVQAYPSELEAANSVGSRIHIVKRVPFISTTSMVTGILKKTDNNDS